MIKEICFRNDWIRAKAKEINADPILVERVLFVFELLGLLIKSDIKLVFKGGTSLILSVPGFKRLSVDLDIVTDEEDQTLKRKFSNITNGKRFKRWEEDRRNQAKEIPKRHFKFYYDSPIIKQELYVLLDILQNESLFSTVVEKPIIHSIFEISEETKVAVPSIDWLAGDKLTAFAPKTIGILYDRGKSMEIIKQLFDLGALFEYISDLEEVHKSYISVSKLEAKYRGVESAVNAFLEDSIEAAFLLCQSGFRGSIENDDTKELMDGIRRIKSHILGGKYSLLQAKADASKVACLASLVKNEQFDVNINKIRKGRINLKVIQNINLVGDHAILNKLKKISPESLYFWGIVNRKFEV